MDCVYVMPLAFLSRRFASYLAALLCDVWRWRQQKNVICADSPFVFRFIRLFRSFSVCFSNFFSVAPVYFFFFFVFFFILHRFRIWFIIIPFGIVARSFIRSIAVTCTRSFSISLICDLRCIKRNWKRVRKANAVTVTTVWWVRCIFMWSHHFFSTCL